MIQVKDEADFIRDRDNQKLRGFYKIPDNAYFQAPGIGASSIIKYSQDPRLFAYEKQFPKQTDALKDGTIFDLLVTAPDEIHFLPDDAFPQVAPAARIYVLPKRFETLKAKGIADYLRDRGVDKKRCTTFRAIRDFEFMKQRLVTHPDWEKYHPRYNSQHDDYLYQVSAFWSDENGTLRKCKPDMLHPDGRYQLDIKRQADVSDRGWFKANRDFWYYARDGWYSKILRNLVPNFEGSIFPVVKNTGPFHCRFLTIRQDQTEYGLAKLEEKLPDYKASEVSQVYPAIYYEGTEELDLPPYAMGIKKEYVSDFS